MNILILTPLHPIAIQSITVQLADILSKDAEYTCIPLCALLSENIADSSDDNDTVLKQNYFTNNILFNLTLRKDKNLLKKILSPKINIIIGNWDKNLKIPFDHIFAYEEEPWSIENDEYLTSLNKILEENKGDLQIAQFDWYTKDDVQYQFPTMHHLITMLKTLGAVDDAIQQ